MLKMLSSTCIATLILLQSPSVLAQAGVPAATASKAPVLDAAGRGQLIDALARELNARYVFPDVAKKLETALREKHQRGGYDSASSAQEFAAMLTTDLQELGRDRHLRVRASDAPQPLDLAGTGRPPIDEARMLARMKEINYGIAKVDKLQGNIGYLDMRGFVPARHAEQAIAAAMTELADSDALIIDMRGNGGGDPASVAVLSSYLFDKRTHLNDLYFRDGDRTEEFWTTETVAGKKYGQQKPVFVLTSPRTFSGGEEFSYNLKQLKRATLVGETTGGGANPGGTRQLTPHFSVFVPGGRAINPITKTNWEHTGVTPDVKVPASEALVTAQKLALSKLASETTDPQRAKSLRARAAELDQSPTASN
ncbi:MAG TPA: S41 family peptidase [Telluria sp.]